MSTILLEPYIKMLYLFTDSNGFTEAPTNDPNTAVTLSQVQLLKQHREILGRFNTFMTMNGNYILSTIVYLVFMTRCINNNWRL